ncbi:MAG: hypothetical protein MR378_10285, partial [Ruminococcus sp.]|nr:hypothetical protein [Ruminococcus sp.]
PLLPVRSAGSLSLILSHSQLLISYRFILLFYHFSVLCASFIFQTRPRNKKSNWFQRTSRRQRKSFSVQQFFKNAAEVWASSPHLRSKLDL